MLSKGQSIVHSWHSEAAFWMCQGVIGLLKLDLGNTLGQGSTAVRNHHGSVKPAGTMQQLQIPKSTHCLSTGIASKSAPTAEVVRMCMFSFVCGSG